MNESKLPVRAKRAHPPPPRGAGAGGGGRANAQAPDASGHPASVALMRDASSAGGQEARPRKLGNGWAPDQIARQKDRTRTKLRAQGLRKELTASEKKMWLLLRDIDSARFRKEVAIGDYVVDFACYGARLLIELDGPSHQIPDVQANDKAKTAYAIRQGFRVLRFANNDVWDRPQWVIDQVRAPLSAPHPPTPSPQGRGGEDA